MTEKKLVRYTDDSMIAGVAAGLARYFDVDPVIVRLIFLLLFFGGGHGLIIYIVLWLLMPEASLSGKAHGFDDDEIVIS